MPLKVPIREFCLTCGDRLSTITKEYVQTHGPCSCPQPPGPPSPPRRLRFNQVELVPSSVLHPLFRRGKSELDMEKVRENMSETKKATGSEVCQACGRRMLVGEELHLHTEHWLCFVCYSYETEADGLREIIRGLKSGLCTITTHVFAGIDCVNEPGKTLLEEVGQIAELTMGKTKEDREDFDEVRIPRDTQVLLTLMKKIVDQIIDDVSSRDAPIPEEVVTQVARLLLGSELQLDNEGQYVISTGLKKKDV